MHVLLLLTYSVDNKLGLIVSVLPKEGCNVFKITCKRKQLWLILILTLNDAVECEYPLFCMEVELGSIVFSETE